MSQRLDTARDDREYKDYTVLTVEPLPERREREWTVSLADGGCLWVATEEDAASPGAPEPGMTLRLFGRGMGYPVRGIGLVEDGALAALYRYQTEAEAVAERQQEILATEEKRRRDWEEGRDDFARRVRALPEPFRNRIEFFMRRQAWGPEFGGYELFSCEEAVKIARHVGAPEKVNAFYADREAQKLCGISEEHSGNTFGTACALARAFLEDPERVPKMHGALCPLVGCEDYGCYATTLPDAPR